MSAATDYSTAWMAPLLAAAAVTAFRPFAYAGAVARWTWYPPQWLLDGAAGMFALMGLVFWWFWLIRLGSTSPAAVRTRVVAFFAAGMPILVTASAYAWNLGFTTFCGRVFRLLNLQI